MAVSRGRILALLAITVAGLADRAWAGSPSPKDLLQDRIQALRAHARYAEALQSARQLLQIQEQDSTTRPYEIKNTVQLVRYAEEAGAAPVSVRLELARADSASGAIDSLLNAGDFQNAEVLARRRLAIRERALRPDHPELGRALADLSWITEELGHYEESLSLARRALDIARKTFGESHPEVAACLSAEALALGDLGDCAGAEPLYRRALSILRSSLRPDDPQLPRTISDFAALLITAGRFHEAEEMNREALALRRRILAPNDPEIGQSLNNLAYSLRREGDFASAEALYGEAISIWRQSLSPNDPNLASALNNLAVLYQYQGDYGAAEGLYRRALDQLHRAYGESHPLIASGLANLAETLRREGRPEEAEQSIRAALDMHRKLLGNEHFMVASDLETLAGILREEKNLPEAERVMREALALQEKVQGPDHPELAGTFQDLGEILYDRGDLAGAEDAYRRTLSLQRRRYAADHPAVVEALVRLGDLQRQEGRLAAAESLLAAAAERFESARVRAGLGVARATFLDSPYPALAACRLELAKSQEAWRDQEEANGRVLADLLLAAGGTGMEPADQARQDSLARALSRLEDADLTLEGGGQGTPGSAADSSSRRVRAELSAVQRSWSLFQYRKAALHPVEHGKAYSLSRIQRSLPESTVLIGWLDVAAEHGGIRSWVYLVRPSGPVIWEPCLSAPSDSAYGNPMEVGSSYRRQLAEAGESALGPPTGREDSPLARALWREKIEPLLPYLDGVRNLIVVPSGAMLGAPIEALIDEDGHDPLDRFAISYVPSATLHAWLAEKLEAKDRARVGANARRTLLVGDPARAAAVRPEEAAGDDLPALRWSREEVSGIATLLPGATILLGSEASEQEIVRLATTGDLRRFSILHFATHALVDNVRPERSAIVLSTADLPDPVASALRGERIYDGLVTAGKIVREWKLDADLVVLSACETALGRSVRGEGYVGLAHALLQVGARSVIVSLWSVNDRATSLLMQRFYHDWLGGVAGGGVIGARRVTKAEALAEAKRWLRDYTDPDGRHPFAHPFYWSAFILMGDPS